MKAMKKLNVLLIALVAGLLVVSCGKSRKPEVKEAAKAAGDGLLGSKGKDLIYILDDRTLINEYVKEQMEKLEKDAGSISEMTEEKWHSIGEKTMALDIEKKEKLQAWEEDYNRFGETLVGIEVPTEVAEGVPLKVVKPFTITKMLYSVGISMEATVELTADRPPVKPRYYYPDSEFMPRIGIVDDDNQPVVSYTRNIPYAPDIKDRKKYLKKGEQVVLNYTFSSTDVKALSAKKLLITWKRPTCDE